MRSFSIAVAALIGSAAANHPAWGNGYDYGYHSYGTGYVSSSSSSTPSSSVVLPTGGYTPVPPPSKSSEYPHPPLSTGESYHPHPPYSTGESYHPHPPYSTGESHPPHPPYSTGVSPPPTTETITTYTTETVCPVTKTYGTQVITTLTTSTITITSCKGGCHHQPTYTPTTYVPPTNPETPITETETITTTTYTWVPCSSPVGQYGPSVIYSTYLTASYYPTTYVTEKVYTPTVTPYTPIETPVYTPIETPVYTPIETPVYTPIYTPVVTPVTVPAECPAPPTVTQTVTVYPQNPQPCHYCETKTLTITEGGYEHTVTVTYSPTDIPTYHPQPPSSTPNGPKPPVPTGGSSLPYIPSGTGYVPYPTHSHHSSSTPYSSGNVGPKPTGYGY